MLQKHEHVPLDVIETILSKLPIRDVLRFRAVSKSWNAIILNPRFARNHLNNARYGSDDDENQLLVWPSRNSGIYHIGRFNGCNEFEAIAHLQCPLKKPHPRPLCSCDGFFLIYDTVSKVCVLWNPITQSKVSFAYPETTIDATTHGICYDSLEDDYKVIFVNGESLLYTVFSCRNNSWTKKRGFPYSKLKKDPGVSVGGIPYWVVAHTNRIVYFDAKDCGFNKFHEPNKIMETDLIRLTNLNGRLCLNRKRRYDTVRAWLMTEVNAWTKLKPSPTQCWYMMTKPLLWTEDGENVRLLDTVGHKSIVVLFEECQAGGIIKTVLGDMMMDSQVVSVRASLAVLTPSKN